MHDDSSRTLAAGAKSLEPLAWTTALPSSKGPERGGSSRSRGGAAYPTNKHATFLCTRATRHPAPTMGGITHFESLRSPCDRVNGTVIAFYIYNLIIHHRGRHSFHSANKYFGDQRFSRKEREERRRFPKTNYSPPQIKRTIQERYFVAVSSPIY